jgi:hypothetical protein
MKDFKPHFEAMHAATEGNREPASKLFKPKRERGNFVPKTAEPIRDWVKEGEEKQEEAAERLKTLGRKMEYRVDSTQ